MTGRPPWRTGFSAVGVDATFAADRTLVGLELLTSGLAQSLPFSDSAFDCLSDITVVQHIPYRLQLKALEEMVRVLKPGGRMILMEVISRKNHRVEEDSHVFPREPRDWITLVENCGVSLIEWFGQEFLLADRLYVRLAQTLSDEEAILSNKSNPPPTIPYRANCLLHIVSTGYCAVLPYLFRSGSSLL